MMPIFPSDLHFDQKIGWKEQVQLHRSYVYWVGFFFPCRFEKGKTKFVVLKDKYEEERSREKIGDVKLFSRKKMRTTWQVQVCQPRGVFYHVAKGSGA